MFRRGASINNLLPPSDTVMYPLRTTAMPGERDNMIMEASLLTSLSTIEQRLNALISAITSSPTAAGAPAATLALLEADDNLSSVLDVLRTHQANYARILHLRAEAARLEESVRGIVRDVARMGDDIVTIAGGLESEEEEGEEQEGEANEEGDVNMGGTTTPQRHRNEIDYKLLLNFARRISKYNTQAASAAESGAIPTKRRLPSPPAQDYDQDYDGNAGVAAITKESTSKLDAFANSIRQSWLLPFPHDDVIRRGIMGKLQAAVAAAGARDERDIEREVDKILRAAEMRGTPQEQAETMDTGNVGEKTSPTDMSGQVAASAAGAGAGERGAAGLSSASGSGSAGRPPPAPAKAKLDLDLYDPDEDEI